MTNGNFFAYKPLEGYIRNPLLDLPRNMKCPCHSGKKFKVCCLIDTKLYIEKCHLREYLEAKGEAMQGLKAW